MLALILSFRSSLSWRRSVVVSFILIVVIIAVVGDRLVVAGTSLIAFNLFYLSFQQAILISAISRLLRVVARWFVSSALVFAIVWLTVFI